MGQVEGPAMNVRGGESRETDANMVSSAAAHLELQGRRVVLGRHVLLLQMHMRTGLQVEAETAAHQLVGCTRGGLGATHFTWLTKYADWGEPT